MNNQDAMTLVGIFSNEKGHPSGWPPSFDLLTLEAEPTGLEPATSDVTGRRSNQLNYDSANLLSTIW